MVVTSDPLNVGLAETHNRYFQPGAGFHYSNTNCQLAAMALEQVSVRSVADLVEERISRPLNLDRTTRPRTICVYRRFAATPPTQRPAS
jgi:D-alanyl-D-alanine carboxypeptidase